MAVEKPHNCRATIEDTMRALKIEIPVKQNMSIILLLSVLMCLWLYGELMVLGKLLSIFIQAFTAETDSIGSLNINFLFLTIWFLGCTAVGFFVIKYLLWFLKGIEIIQLNRDGLSIEKKFSLLTPNKLYPIKKIKNLQINQLKIDSDSVEEVDILNIYNARSIGSLKFEFDSETIYFASYLDEAEARYILDKIRNKGYWEQK